MKALILAAGRGSRLGSLTSEKPKGMVALGGRSLIARAMDSLRQGGCTEIGLATGYRAEVLDGLVARTFHNPRWAETNMVMSLAAAADWLRAEPVIVSYSDIFYTPETVKDLCAATAEIAISYDKDWRALWEARSGDPLADAETFQLDSQGRLIEIGRRAKSLAEIQGQYMGLLKFTPAGWAKVEALLASLEPPLRDKLDMTGLLSRLLSQGMPIATVAQTGVWGECDTPGDLQLYESWLAAGRLKSA
jgi:L-glutamine-phosphate cytidylyltransferase